MSRASRLNGRVGAADLDAIRVEGNIGTRLFAGRLGTLTLAGALSTSHVMTEAPADFDAVRVILASTDNFVSKSARAVAVSTPAAIGDGNNSGGTWIQAVRSGLNRIYLPTAPGASGRNSYQTTDWVAASSVARTDVPGGRPLVCARVSMSMSGGVTCYGNGTDDFTNWASRTDGNLWIARNQAGVEGTQNPANFTTTTNASQSVIIGFQFLVRGKIVTHLIVGDSTDEGRGTFIGRGFAGQAIEEMSGTAGNPTMVFANSGWSGQAMATFGERAIDILNSDHMRPDVLIMPAGSPNDPANSPITATHVATWRRQTARVQAACRAANVPLILVTVMPVNSSVNNWGTSDSLRRDYNAEVLAKRDKGVLVLDASTLMSGATTGGQVQMRSDVQTDGIHPDDRGNAILAEALKPLLRLAMGQVKGNRVLAPTSRGAWPTFLVTDTDAHVNQSGTWVYATTSGDGAWTVMAPSNNDSTDKQRAQIKVRDAARKLVLTGSGGTVFKTGSSDSTTLTLLPGQSCELVGSGGVWEVHGFTPGSTRRVKTDTGTTMTMSRDQGLQVFAGTAAATWTLPSAATSEGVEFFIKNRGSATVTIARAGSDTIYNTADVTTIDVTAGSALRLICDGTRWLVL